MISSIGWRGLLAAAIVAVSAGRAPAQMPVCPQPEPGRPVYQACFPGGRFVIVPLLTSLALDHTVRGDAGPILREPRAIFRAAATQTTLENNKPLDDYLERLGSVRLIRLDTSTGTLALDVGEDERTFHSNVSVGFVTADVSVTLPEKLEGGYWRTPGVFQVAFWKGERPSFRISFEGRSEIAGEIECASVSGDGIRLVMNGTEARDVLVLMEGCQ